MSWITLSREDTRDNSVKLASSRARRNLIIFLIISVHQHGQLVRLSSASVGVFQIAPNNINPNATTIQNNKPRTFSLPLYSNSTIGSSSNRISNRTTAATKLAHPTSESSFANKKYSPVSTSFKKSIDSGVKGKNNSSNEIFIYPRFERNESLIENIFGKQVADPYRSLEDPTAEQTKEFIRNQNEITEPYLKKCPHRGKIKQLLTQAHDYEKIKTPFKRGEKYYYYANTGLQPQSILYQQDSIDGKPRVFLDPNKLSMDGTVAVNHESWSPNGKYFAFALSYNGSDWLEIRIKDVATSREFPERLTRAKFTTIEWTHDNNGFFYAQYPQREGTDPELCEYHSVYYHVLNTRQDKDILKIDFPQHPKWNIDFELSHDGALLHVHTQDGRNGNQWFYCRLSDFKLSDKFSLKQIYGRTKADFSYISNNGDTVYFKTNLEAKNYRIVKMNITTPAKENWIDVVPNHEHDVLDSAHFYTVNRQDYLLINILRKVVNYLELHRINVNRGAKQQSPPTTLVKKFKTLPGKIGEITGRRNDGGFFFEYSSFLTAGQIYHFNMSKLDSEPRLWREMQLRNFNEKEFQFEQVFFRSKDGTEVPMFIIHRRNLVRDGKSPCIMSGYGGFNVPIPPSFDADLFPWIKNFRGIYAVANVRGGGELGKNWHDSGRLLNKQNSFDDFIAAGEYLIRNNYTNRNRLAMEGASNGGLLVAAAANQRPDLFAATICHVAVLDMIRFASFTIGHAWVSEYGDPSDLEHFKNLIKYSPYHNIPDSVDHYPATLLLTAEHDDRVVPAHSLKFIAQLQHKLGQKLPKTPLLIRVETKAGHGDLKPISMVIEDYTEIYSFLYNSLRLEKYFHV